MRGRWKRVVGAAAAVAMLMTLFSAIPAGACSRYLVDPRDQLHEDDTIAFIGTLVERQDRGNGIEDDYTFDVEEWFKGGPGDQIVIRSFAPAVTCGFGDAPVGSRLALIAGDWTDGSKWSDYAWPEEILREASSPFPAPADGEPRLLIGGSFGETRVQALDRAGRTVGYGYGEGDVSDLSVCPGAKNLAEFFTDQDGDLRVAIRRMTDLVVTRRVSVPGSGIGTVECTQRDGDRTLVAVQDHGGAGVVFRFAGHHLIRLLRTDRRITDLREGAALLVGYGRVIVRDLGTSTRHEVTTGSGNRLHDVRWSPNGRYIAGAAAPTDPSKGPRPLVFLAGPNGVVRKRLGRYAYLGRPLHWAGNPRFIVGTRVFDLDLQIEAKGVGVGADIAAPLGDRLYEVGSGYLYRSDLGGSGWSLQRTFFSQITLALEALPAGVQIEAPPHS
jgi:hypothetical protein